MAGKMVALDVQETSLVDHPAHLHPGWIVMKDATKEAPTVGIDKSDAPPKPDDKTPAVDAEGKTVVAADGVPPSDTPAPDVTDPETVVSDGLTEMQSRIVDLEAKVAELLAAQAQDMSEEPSEPAATEVGPDGKPVDVPVDQLVKSAPPALAKALTDALKEASDAKAELAKAATEKGVAEATSFVKSLDRLVTDAPATGGMLFELRSSKPELAKAVEELMSALNGQAESADIFAEIGKSSRSNDGAIASDRINSLAKARVDAGDFPTIEQAVAAVVTEQPDLYTDARKGI